jgi:hypothetical protein
MNLGLFIEPRPLEQKTRRRVANWLIFTNHFLLGLSLDFLPVRLLRPNFHQSLYRWKEWIKADYELKARPPSLSEAQDVRAEELLGYGIE